MRRHWRRFKAKVRPGLRSGYELQAETERLLESVLRDVYGNRRVYAEHLHEAVREQANRVLLNPVAAEWCALLILRAPLAARAQRNMDKHPHGSPAQQSNLFELIDFNDTFIATVLALNAVQRKKFVETIKGEMARFCKRVGAAMFTDDEYDAITRGLTKEIAVYLGALSQGYQVEMTSRAKDAMGVDMLIADSLTNRVLNIDCKTSSAYHYRLKDLVREGRLTERQAEQAEINGYVMVMNGHGAEAINVVLLRIDPNEVGDIQDFVFTKPELLGGRLRQIFMSQYKQ